MRRDCMRRRSFITLLTGAAAWPILTRAQQAEMLVVGFLSGTRLDQPEIAAVRHGLEDSGYREGQNIRIEYRSADGEYDRLSALASDLVSRKVAVVIAIGGTVSVRAAKAATATIPIVFATAGDPVQLRLVTSLNRPGGNITGVSFLGAGLAAKRLEILHDLKPTAKIIGLLVNPLNPNSKSEMSDVQAAVSQLGEKLIIQNASDGSGIAAAFTAFSESNIDALFVAADAVFTSRRQQLVQLAAEHAIPTIYALPEFVAAGGLISYGPSRVEAFRLVGVDAGKILKGQSPAELPVEQSTKIELAINLKTARTLGLTVPEKLIVAADNVTE
jgi:putative tryptophan/tyrosine transport system substrate-binding protein